MANLLYDTIPSAQARVTLTLTQPEDIDERFLRMFLNLNGKNRYFRLSGKEFTRDELVTFCRCGLDAGNVFYYSVCAADNGDVIGCIRLGPIDFDHSVSDMVALIGDASDRDKGLGTEAIRLGQEIAFRKHGIRKLSGGVLEPNIGSLKAYARAGWVEEGRLKGHYVIDGKPADWVVISCFNPSASSQPAACR